MKYTKEKRFFMLTKYDQFSNFIKGDREYTGEIFTSHGNLSQCVKNSSRRTASVIYYMLQTTQG